MINVKELIVEIIFFIKIIKKTVVCFKILYKQLTETCKETELHEKNNFFFFLMFTVFTAINFFHFN